MKHKLHTLIILIIFTMMGSTFLGAQFDDLYYDPDKDFQLSQEEEYQVYEDDDYYDEEEYEYDSYYDDYDYATRINRFRRSAITFDYFSTCYLLNRWNNYGFDPYYDNFYYDRYYRPGTSIYISFGNNFGWNRWNRWDRWNNWYSYRPWYGSYYPGFYGSWGYNAWWPSSYGYGNRFYANNYYYGNNHHYGNIGNHGYYNSYDRVSNPNGVYYGSRNARSTVASSKGRLKSPRGNVDYNTSRVTDNNTNSINTNRKSYRKGDIAANAQRSNRIFDRKKSNIDQRRTRNTYRSTTSSRTKSNGIINRGSSRTNVYKGTTSRTRIDRRNSSSRTLNRNNTSSRTRTVNPRTNSSRNNRSFNTSRSSNRSSSSMNRSSTKSSNTRSSTSKSSSPRSSRKNK